MRTVAFITIALSFGTAPLLGQNTFPSPGDRVRVQAVGESSARIFTLKEVVADTLVLEDLKAGPSATRMATGSVSRLQVSEGFRSEGARALRGAAWGFGGGALVGATIGLASGDDEATFLAFSAEEKAVIAGVTIGAVGLVIGTVVGLAANPEQWRSVSLDQITVSPSATGALEVGFQYRLN
jgi:hypothetical protein